MKTWPQNVGNHISEDLIFIIFKIFWGAMPPDPLQGTAFGGPKNEPPYVKSWIRPSRLPPTQAALHQAILCAHFQLIVWNKDAVPNPLLSSVFIIGGQW